MYTTGIINTQADVETTIRAALLNAGATHISYFDGYALAAPAAGTKDPDRNRLAVSVSTITTTTGGVNYCDIWFTTRRLGRTSEDSYDVISDRHGFKLAVGNNPESAVFPITYHIYIYDREIFIGLEYRPGEYQWAGFSLIFEGAGTKVTTAMSASFDHEFDSANTYTYGQACTLDARTSGSSYYLRTSGGGTGQYGYGTCMFMEGSATAVSYYTGESATKAVYKDKGYYASEGYRTICLSSWQAFTVGCAPGYIYGTAALAPVEIGVSVDNTRLNCAYVGVLDNVRFSRCDMVLPGETITFGSETWQLWPVGKRDIATISGAVAYAFRVGV